MPAGNLTQSRRRLIQPFGSTRAVKAIETNGEGCPFQKRHFYAAIAAIGERLKVSEESADDMRRRAMQTTEAGVLWSAHNLVQDLPPKERRG